MRFTDEEIKQQEEESKLIEKAELVDQVIVLSFSKRIKRKHVNELKSVVDQWLLDFSDREKERISVCIIDTVNTRML